MVKVLQSLLTVIVPVFNDENNILRCLESLYNQTFSDFEIIVINDASTDNTRSILKQYQKNHKFTIIDMEQNFGVSHCRNVGIKASQTSYITFVDSDDWLDISTYMQCFQQINKDLNVDIIIYGLMYDYVLQNYRYAKYQYTKTYHISGTLAFGIYTHTIPNEIRITPIVNNKIYRRQFLIENNLLFHENLRYQEDDVFTFEVFMKAKNVTIVDQCFYHYCQRSNSMIHTVSEYSIYNFIKAYITLQNILKTNHLFVKHKDAFYLKFKGSLLGILNRIMEYTTDIQERNQLMYLLLTLLIENFDVAELLNTVKDSTIRSILQD